MFAGELIEAARDWSSAFSRGRFGDGILLRQLRTIIADLFARAVGINPDALAAPEPAVIEHAAITAALDSRQSVEVPAYLTPITAVYRYANGRGTSRVAFVTLTQVLNNMNPFPAVVPLPAALRFLDLRDYGSHRSGWEEEGTLEFYYVPEPAAPTALTGDQGTVNAPAWMRPKIEAELAMWMAGRVGDIPADLERAAARAEEGFMAALLAHQAGSSWYVQSGA